MATDSQLTVKRKVDESNSLRKEIKIVAEIPSIAGRKLKQYKETICNKENKFLKKLWCCVGGKV